MNPQRAACCPVGSNTVSQTGTTKGKCKATYARLSLSEHTSGNVPLNFKPDTLLCGSVCIFVSVYYVYTMQAQQIPAFTDYWLVQQYYSPL